MKEASESLKIEWFSYDLKQNSIPLNLEQILNKRDYEDHIAEMDIQEEGKYFDIDFL